MFNPFKKRAPEPAHEPAPQTQPMPDNSALVSLIHTMKIDTFMGDLRPMHRAILGSQLLVPLHEPPTVTPQGTRMLYMTFDNAVFGPQSTMALFTDAARMREFFGPDSSVGARVCVGFWDGKTACNAAMSAEMPHLAINPLSDAHYAMPPHVYRALAFGYVPSSVAQTEIKTPQIAIARPLSGMPSEQELSAWREVLRSRGASAAFWFNVLLDDVMELRYAIGVACAPESFQSVRDELISTWFGIWPVNTPLFVYQLTDDAESSAIRAGGAPIFP